MSKNSITKALGKDVLEIYYQVCEWVSEESAKDIEYKDGVKKSNEIVEKIEALIPEGKQKEFKELLSDLMMNEALVNDVTTLYVQHKTFKLAQQLMVNI